MEDFEDKRVSKYIKYGNGYWRIHSVIKFSDNESLRITNGTGYYTCINVSNRTIEYFNEPKS